MILIRKILGDKSFILGPRTAFLMGGADGIM
jgi:hypothetical protein